jgi:predicted PurR-regulated permease PerM
MNTAERKGFAGPLRVIAVFIVAALTLRYAQDFFLPLVLAGLLSFLLSPLVRRLERWRLGRVGAVLLTAVMAFVLIGGLTYLVTNQFLDLAGSLPKYRDNLIAKVSALKVRGDSLLGRAERTITEVKEAMTKPEKPPVFAAPAVPPVATLPVPVEIARTDNTIRMLMELVSPVIGPLGMALMVILIAIFMLLAGSDLRDRLIHLLGRSRLRITTQALDEVAQRISRYLRMQLLVNASFGVAIAVGLYLIGIQNALFWGLLGMVLRFLPYIGAWIAAAFPIALAIAMFESWTPPLLTVGLFVAVEIIISNVLEPWLYGTSAEISSLAVVVSAIFWTWLWGGVGLVLATPMTVCLVVAGKYLPDLGFLDLLLGDKPAIAPADRLYQRLLALNAEEAGEIVEKYAEKHSALAAFDAVLLPALRAIEVDFRAGVLPELVRGDACQIVRDIIADLPVPPVEAAAVSAIPSAAGPILLLPAYHEPDELAALMLAKILAASGIVTTVLSSKLLASEEIEQTVALAPRIVCISSILPVSIIAARALCKRLRSQLPSTRILVGLWEPDDAKLIFRRDRLASAGADATHPDLRRCSADIAEFAACTPPETGAPATA